MSDKVLVVIPTLNRPEMCARAARSVLAQKYENWDCIIALNGMEGCGHEKATAYTKALGDLLCRPSFYLWRMRESGLGKSLNYGVGLGLKVTQASYWMNLEDDDELDPDYLEVMVSAAVESGADVVHCLQRQVPGKIQSDGGPMHPIHLQRRNWINWPMCLWRKEVYEKVGPIAEDVGPSTDWDYHLRCVKAGIKYHFVDRVLVTHHWHSGGKGGTPNYCLLVDGRPYIAKRRAEGVYG